MRRARQLVVVGWACAVALAVVGCGSSDDEAATTPTQTVAPESRFSSDAEVTRGLKDLVRVSQDISRQQGAAASKKKSEGLEPIWMKVEGTVKKKEPDSYATIEEDLSLLESGDAKKTKTGADEMSATVDAYLAKHAG